MWGFKFLLACTAGGDNTSFLLPDLYKGLRDTGGDGLCVNSLDAIKQLLTNGVQIVLALAGIAAVFMILYAGFTYITSNGNAPMITRAKDTLVNWVIGLIVIIGAYAIVGLVSGALN
jgi:hypothetical protein